MEALHLHVSHYLFSHCTNIKLLYIQCTYIQHFDLILRASSGKFK